MSAFDADLKNQATASTDRGVAALAILVLCIGTVLLFADPARAATPASTPAQPTDTGLTRALAGTAVSAGALARSRGGALSLQMATTNGSLTNTTVSGTSVTGRVNAANSVNNNAGLTTVFMNSGNNALLQNTMTINVTIH